MGSTKYVIHINVLGLFIGAQWQNGINTLLLTPLIHVLEIFSDIEVVELHVIEILHIVVDGYVNHPQHE